MPPTPLADLLPQRLVKAVLAGSIGLFALLAAIGNLQNPATNRQFVRHVLAMDSMQPWFLAGPALGARAVTDQGWQQVVFGLIIGGELASGVLCLAAGIVMLGGACSAAPARFARGRRLFTIGCLPALLVWYSGFVVIGGEYFFMWANRWNGQATALAFCTVILLALIYIGQPEPGDSADLR